MADPGPRLQLPPVFGYQAAALFGPQRYAVVEGSTKVGKTYPCLVWLLEMCGRLPGPDHNFWWVAPTSGQAAIAYTRTKRMLLQADPTKTIWASHDTLQRITIHGCGHLWYKTGEVPDNLYGEDVYAAVMDEYTRQREEAWFALRSTLTATEGRCRFIGNVKGRRNWGYLWARKAESGDPSMTYAKLTCWDAVEAGIMSREEVEQAQRDLPPAVFRELYLAEPDDDGNNPFGLNAIAACVCEIHKDCAPVAWGWDLARAKDWTVGIGLCEHGKVCRFERWNQTTMPVGSVRGKVKPREGDSHRAYWAVTLRRVRDLTGYTPALVDATGPGGPIEQALIAEGQYNIEGYVFTNRSKQMLMEGLAVDIQQQEIGFPDGPIRSELDAFEYEYVGAMMKYAAPEGVADDCVCALALAAEKRRRLRSGAGYVPFIEPAEADRLTTNAGKHAPPLAGNLTHAQTTQADMDLSIASGATRDIGFAPDKDGALKLWTPLRRGRPRLEDQFAVFAVAGDGQSSPGVVVVADVGQRTVAAQYVRNVPPERLARAVAMLALWFGPDDHPAPIGYLANTPGLVLGQHLDRINSGGQAWEPTAVEFAEALGVLRAAWEGGQFVERDPSVFAVARQYVWSNSTMMHASLVGTPERRGSWADPLMARAGLWRMVLSVDQDPAQEREPPVGSSEHWIRQERRRSEAKDSGGIAFG